MPLGSLECRVSFEELHAALWHPRCSAREAAEKPTLETQPRVPLHDRGDGRPGMVPGPQPDHVHRGARR